jgi:hypothetical protein
MKRLAQFLRSVIPADPWQLVFLAGVVFLFICTRLPWRPSAEILMSNAIPLGLDSDTVIRNIRLVAALLYPTIFAGLVGYVTCFYPAPKPVRRILWAVILPTLVSLVFISIVIYQISRTPSSVLESQAALPFAYRWPGTNIWGLPVGFDFSIFSLLLIAVFVIRLRTGSSCFAAHVDFTS